MRPADGRRPAILAATAVTIAAAMAKVAPPGDWTCSASCDSSGCVPLRFVWGVQKAGTSSLFALLSHHWACGAGIKFTAGAHGTISKESHFLVSPEAMEGNVSRAAYAAAYLPSACRSLCFVDGTPDYSMTPLAAARLRSILYRSEADSARFVLQLREPVSRFVSFFRMVSRFDLNSNLVNMSVSADVHLKEWSTFLSRDPSGAAETHFLLQQLQKCTDNCSALAMRTAYRGAVMAARCDIRPAEYVGDGGEPGRLVTASGKCGTGNCNMLSRGIYAFSIHWLSTQFSREQLLLLSMHEALTTQPSVYLKQVLDFLGFPASAQYPLEQDMPQSNSATAEQLEDVMSEELRDKMAAVYAPWNEVLYAMEPQFQRFPPPS